MILFSISELWGTFVEWWNTSGIEILTQIGVGASMVASVVVTFKNLKKTTTRELKALAENYQLTKEQKHTDETITDLQSKVDELNDLVDKLVGMNVLLLKNSKISFDDKQKALDLMKARGTKTKEILDKPLEIKEVVEEIFEDVKQVVEEGKTENLTGNEYIDKLKPLIDSGK